MTLSARARQVAAAAPLHQSAAVLRECADALDAKDAEIASLKADLSKSNSKLARDQHALGIAGSALDANEIEFAKLKDEIATLQAELAAFREAVGALPEYEHEGPGDGYGCPARHDRGIRCQCEAGRANAALAAARKLAGKE